MTNGILLESLEGLESSSARSGALWEILQGEKEQVFRELSADGPVVFSNGFAPNERDPSDEYGDDIRWHRRDQLENHLREIIDAQDRLMDGCYGQCGDCGKQIERKRLFANPTATLCISCQRSNEAELAFHTM